MHLNSCFDKTSKRTRVQKIRITPSDQAPIADLCHLIGLSLSRALSFTRHFVFLTFFLLLPTLPPSPSNLTKNEASSFLRNRRSHL